MALPLNVFISYAHEDESLKDDLLQHLAGLVRDGLIRVWHDRRIDGGDSWISRIDNALEQSSLVLLLVSPSFLASDYSYGAELRRALAKAAAGEARVIPIIVRPSDWQTRQLRDLQALPRDGRAVTSWANRDEAFLDVVQGIKAVIPHLEGAQPGAQRADASADALRYYLYISDVKVDMLLPQIPREADRAPAPGPDTSTRIQRLDIVRRYLEGSGRIGTVDAPRDYVAGTHDLYWGRPHASFAEREPSPIVVFCGRTAQTSILLCGTTRHIVGSHHPDGRGFSSSDVPAVLEAFLRSVEVAGAAPDAFNETSADSPARSQSELIASLIDDAHLHVSGVEQTLEFLARPLLVTATGYGQRCLLASPLYVALST